MSSQRVYHHNPCCSRVQPIVLLTHLPHKNGRLLLSSSLFSRKHCSNSAARRCALQCSSNPDGQQGVSDQSPAGGNLSASQPCNSVLLAVGSIGLAVVAFVASRSLLGRPALDELRLQSMPLDSALANGRPTVLEFYADWCEVCNELAPTALEVGPGWWPISCTQHTCRHHCTKDGTKTAGIKW